MSYVRKNSVKVLGSVVGLILAVAIGLWQFYQFVTFTDPKGVVDLQGGTGHLWWAIAMAVFACIAGFYVFSVFARHDTDDELHITS